MRTRAAVAMEAGKPLEIMEVNLEGPKTGEVLVEIKATGICHTDEFTLSGADPEGIFPAILVQLIKFAHFRAEHVNNYIACVHKHPIACALAFHLRQNSKIIFQATFQLFGNGCDLTRRAPRTDHHVIANLRNAPQIYLHDVFSFIIF